MKNFTYHNPTKIIFGEKNRFEDRERGESLREKGTAGLREGEHQEKRCV